MRYPWDEALTTGLESVDEQHRHLLKLLGDLVAAMEAGRASREIGRILDELAAYTDVHFGHEERCMTEYACPAAADNERAHREFRVILDDFRDEFESRGPSPKLVVRLEQQLVWWLDNHIRHVDTKLYPCVLARASN